MRRIIPTCLALVSLISAPAWADPVEHDRIRAELALDLTRRTFDLSGPSEVLFDAPYYLGLRLGVALFPVALFANESPAAGLGVQFQTAKHNLNTVAELMVDDTGYEYDVPTRHDVSHFGAVFEWAATGALTLTPSVGWHAEEIALGYNPLYRNSFYKGVEIGLRGDYGLGPEGLTAGAGVAVRPAVDIGSTVEPYGESASSFGLAFDGGLRYASRLGLYGDVSFDFARYKTTYRPDRGTGVEDSTSTDKFQSFVFTVGYAY